MLCTSANAQNNKQSETKTIAEQYKERLRYPMGDFSTQAYPRDNDADYYYYGRQRKTPKVKYYPYPQDNDQAYYWYYYDKTEANNYLHPGAYPEGSRKKLVHKNQTGQQDYIVVGRLASPQQRNDKLYPAAEGDQVLFFDQW